MRGRIPQRVIRRRHDAEADANAAYYNGPKKPGGPCARCSKVEDDHFAGMCDDNGPYTPAADPEYSTRIDAQRATLELQRKSPRRADAGRESIEDSPLFGGARQGRLF